MADWFDDQQNPQDQQNVNENVPVPGETPAGQAPEAPADPPAPPVQQGWSSNASQWTAPPTPPVPPQQSWQPTPPQSPYGWGAPQQPTQPPKRRHTGTVILVVVLAIICAASLIGSVLLIGGQISSRTNGGTSQHNTEKKNPDAPQIITTEPKREGLTDEECVAANLNSTVIIRMFSIDNFSSFFYTPSNEETEAGEATGIVWTEDGYIITNAHCVYNEDTGKVFSRIEVELYDGTVFESADIVGYDTTTDLAVIRVDAENLTPAVFGDSDALRLGARVLALGNNSGLGWTVTGGMVSGLARDVYEETNYAIKCLQVDAVINPGNSGGPLINSSGQVVGINSAKIVASGYEGLGFSIPINEASRVLNDLVQYGFVKGRIMLGIEGYTFNRYSGYEGFYISSIKEGSSFTGTAARVGDIITHVNGERVKSYAEMREQLTAYAVGDKVTITLLRIDQNRRSVDTLDVTITLMESDGTV